MEEWGLVLIFLVIIIVLLLAITGYTSDNNVSWWTRYRGSSTFDDFSNTNDNHNTFESDSSSGYDGESSDGDSSGGDSSSGD
jgi:hypothetical protein